MIEELENILEHIKSHEKYDPKTYKGNFPNSNKLEEKPHQHFHIIVEQSERVLKILRDKQSDKIFLGVLSESSDLRKLVKLLTEDIRQFSTYSNLNFLRSFCYSQSTLPSNTLFHLSRSYLLGETYKYIELLDQKSTYEIYAIPFLIRLAIEKKLKAMIGFSSSKIYFSNDSTKSSDQFPTGKIINFLKDSDLIVSTYPFNELKKIYEWSCRFVHTGHKEYIWMTLKAVDCLDQLFNRDNNHEGYQGVDIVYLKEGVTLHDLESAINNSPYFNKLTESSVKEESVELQLNPTMYARLQAFTINENRLGPVSLAL